MNGDPIVVDDWMVSQTDDDLLVCTKFPLPLVADEQATARIDGLDVVLTWSAGCYNLQGLGRTDLRPGMAWMIGVVDLSGKPVAAMDVETAR